MAQLKLRVVSPNRNEIQLDFKSFPIRFGRDRDVEVTLEDSSISRRHAEISLDDGKIRIRDNKSLNGIRVNGEICLESDLHSGDVISIGIYEVTVVDPMETQRLTMNDEIVVRPEGTSGVLEIIRAIDVTKVLDNEGNPEDVWSLGSKATEEPLSEDYRKLHQAYSNLMVLMNVASGVGNYSHPQQICAQFSAALRRIFPLVENISVVEMPTDGTEPRIVHQERRTGTYITLSQPSRTVLKRVIREMRAMYAVDASRDPRFQNSDSVKTQGVRSMMCAPLMARGDAIGAIYVENLTQPFCFNHFELNLLTVFAFHLAIAMETARLLDERDKAFERAAISIKAAKQDKVALILQYSQSEKKFRALFEQSALGAAVINMETMRIEEVNDGLVHMLGYTRKQFVGMEYAWLLIPEERKNPSDGLERVRSNGEGSWKSRLITSTGETIVALLSCRTLRLGDSQVMVAYFIDITAQERAETATRTQLQRVTVLSELSQELMARLDSGAIMELLCRKVRTVIPTDHFYISLAGKDDGLLHPAFEAFHEDEKWHSKILEKKPVEPNSAAKKVLLSNQPVSLSTAESEAKGLPEPFALPNPRNFSSSLYVPLSSHKASTGIVCVQSREHKAYDNSHIETLRALVAQAALALLNASAFESIREQEESLRQLSVQIMTTQETERGRISRELHDGIGQQLTAMKYLLEGIRNAARGGDSEKLLNRVNESHELATQIIADLRSISLDLRPTMLDDLGLRPTLEWFSRQYIDRHEIDVNLSCDIDESLIAPEVATTAYRIIQEALGNVAKHAKAKKVSITLNIEGGMLQIEIQDNGIGFRPQTLHQAQTVRGCSGMLNMKERTRFLGGDFHLETAPGKGTTLTLSIPVKEKSESCQQNATSDS